MIRIRMMIWNIIKSNDLVSDPDSTLLCLVSALWFLYLSSIGSRFETALEKNFPRTRPRNTSLNTSSHRYVSLIRDLNLHALEIDFLENNKIVSGIMRYKCNKVARNGLGLSRCDFSCESCVCEKADNNSAYIIHLDALCLSNAVLQKLHQVSVQ